MTALSAVAIQLWLVEGLLSTGLPRLVILVHYVDGAQAMQSKVQCFILQLPHITITLWAFQSLWNYLPG